LLVEINFLEFIKDEKLEKNSKNSLAKNQIIGGKSKKTKKDIASANSSGDETKR
jgi:hypothetical protein